ncbi:phosphate ABC transporter substrate-binding protein PstS [Labilibaculum sp. A4]|uniref:Phosphate-binding protein n=1 Tax=Labilibaculum euxinus TaxID=2686357 RepID=A0A425YBS0_9BACT|nr:phosphate ABC transporter substrate-binding protein PstS [Labilibaculum euxinus]MDQ1771471.1 phosphate ABC transporter substrate-binding protein PstS [Labilibaculum euxinus]MUP38266.1 phosphate ABC transporter substrate-binding protein PstS [Labilibaculum euxinus]MVB07471.1 phosphate ABC transporter substrate-binding protein PstS [Labilibaculum euxinus]MWN76641.1 phosphate ABC transporter substrate-binding protein PstS [Labilibaculum euxinus]
MKKFQLLLTAVIAVALMAGCGGSGKEKAKTAEKAETITGAGATFPQPFYNKIFKNYSSEKGLLVTYGGIGSGGGIRSLKDEIVDFGASDAFLNDAKLAEMPGKVLHIPTCLGAVVAAYNLPEKPELKFTPELMEGIFMGKITNWNDAKIAAVNPGINLPDLAITVVYRSDGSGTTFIFSDYMSKVSADWKEKIGTGKALQWPVGIGAKGNPGVAGTISQTVGAIGYIGSEYAFAQDIPVASIQNLAGNFIKPSVESVSASAKGEMPADTRVSLTNTDAVDGYPISSFTWLIIYKEQNYKNRSLDQAVQTIKLIDWAISADAQKETTKVHYAPLPETAVAKAKAVLSTVTYNGKSLK